jgi:hypothetical protein
MSKFDGEILGRLADLTPDEITAALAVIREEAATFQGQTPTADVVARTGELADAARQLAGEQSRRAELAQTNQGNLDALTELTTPPAVGAPDVAPAETPVETPAAALTETADEPEGTPDAEEAPAEETGEETVTASARRRLGSNNTGAPAGTPVRRLPRVAFTTTAATGLRDAVAGEVLDREKLYTAFHSKIDAVRSGNVAGSHVVATVRADFPEERYLSRNDSGFTVLDKIGKAVKTAQGVHATANQQSLVAAGLCAPLENLYDIEVIGDDDRPVRDALVRFGVDRGGIQYRPTFDGVTQTGGIGVWTAANDTDVTEPLDVKTCAEIDCPALEDATVDAIYQCLTFSNMSTRFDPEWMESVIRAQRVAHARFAENRLLTQLYAGSKNVASTEILGATRDTLFTLDHMIAYYRSVHRLRDEVPLRWIAPQWFKYMLRADIAYQMVGDGLVSLAVTDAMITSWFADRNINVTWHLDGVNPPDVDLATDVVTPSQVYTLLAANAVVPPFITPVSTLLFREGDWLHLDGGTLDLGTVRDSTLNSRNRFQTFSEAWEGTAFRGIESFQLVLQVHPTGQSAATADASAAV